MNGEKILIIAAHPDDDVLGCGGLMAKYHEQNDIKVLFLGEGTTCRYNTNQLNSESVKKEISKRNNYGISALSLLGVDSYRFLNLPCGRFDQLPIIEIGKEIESEISDFEPTVVFTHSSKDVNRDHVTSFYATLQATRPGINNYINKLYSYEILSSSEWHFQESFQPNFFVELNKEHLDKKVQALMEYKSEVKPFPFPRSKEGVITLAKYRGMQSACHYAEAFMLIREFQK